MLLVAPDARLPPLAIDAGVIWGAERTAIVLVSERLREGQVRGILHHVESAQRWLTRLQATLQRGKQKRSRARIEQDIAARLRGRQHLRDTIAVELGEKDGCLTLAWKFDQAAFEALASSTLGRLVLITSRHDWSIADVIRAYRAQADIEAVFRHLKNPRHLALRPQFHWTDQKLHVHVFSCLLGYLLTRLLHLRASNAGAPYASSEALLEALARVRRARVAHLPIRPGKPRITDQLEQLDPQIESFLPALGVTA